MQEVDVLRAPCHVSFPISVPGPRAVATSPTLIAVSAWKTYDGGDHAVHLFDAVTYAPLRVAGASLAYWYRVRC